MLLVPLPITRAFIQANRDWTFVYSTNIYYTSSYGQASQAAGEPNTIGLPVRFRFCKSNMASLFSDDQFTDVLRPTLDNVFSAIRLKLPRVCVFPKIGEGASRLKEVAPKTFAYIRGELAKLHSNEVEFIW